MPARNPDPWFVIAGRLFYDGWNFAQFVSAFTFASWASRVTGINWLIPIGPWLFVIGAAAWGIVLVRVLRRVINYVKVVIDRPVPQIELLSSGTSKAILEIAHFGAPLSYRVEGRVVRVLHAGAQPRPPEQRFICELQPEEGRSHGTRLQLRNGEWAHIVIAESNSASKNDDGHVLWIRRGSYGRQARAPDSGVEMEFTIHTQPAYPVGTLIRRIQVVRDVKARTVSTILVDD